MLAAIILVFFHIHFCTSSVNASEHCITGPAQSYSRLSGALKQNSNGKMEKNYDPNNDFTFSRYYCNQIKTIYLKIAQGMLNKNNLFKDSTRNVVISDSVTT